MYKILCRPVVGWCIDKQRGMFTGAVFSPCIHLEMSYCTWGKFTSIGGTLIWHFLPFSGVGVLPLNTEHWWSRTLLCLVVVSESFTHSMPKIWNN